MAILSDEDTEAVREELEALESDVTIHLFLEDGCQFCDEAVELNEELTGLSEKVTLEQHEMDGDLADEYDANKYDDDAPVAVITSDEGRRVHYYGIPSGHEFSSYLGDVIAVSTGQTDLPDPVVEKVREIDEPVNIKVFVTPTCPYCPQAVRTAHDFAIENDNVTAEMIEAQEFQGVSQEFGVQGVPQINVNGDDAEFTGALPPQQFLDQVESALDA